MTLSEPQVVVHWVLAIESLREGNIEDAVSVIAMIQAEVENDPPGLVPFLELSAYALLALDPPEDELISHAEQEFGPLLRDDLGLPCDPEIIRGVLRSPAGPIEDLPPGLGLNGALYVSFAILASIARRDSGPAPAVDFVKAALRMRSEVEGPQ
jgi:hypothetical protein